MDCITYVRQHAIGPCTQYSAIQYYLYFGVPFDVRLSKYKQETLVACLFVLGGQLGGATVGGNKAGNGWTETRITCSDARLIDWV